MIGALALLVVLIGSGFAVHESLSRDDARGQVGTAPPVSPAIEARWGVRVSHVGVSADGGLVDVRFVVLDPDRALALLGDALLQHAVHVVEDGDVTRLRLLELRPPPLQLPFDVALVATELVQAHGLDVDVMEESQRVHQRLTRSATGGLVEMGGGGPIRSLDHRINDGGVESGAGCVTGAGGVDGRVCCAEQARDRRSTAARS